MVVETYKIRVNASMVGDVGVEPTMLSHMGLNHASMPVRVIPHTSAPVYIYEKRYAKTSLVLVSGLEPVSGDYKSPALTN